MANESRNSHFYVSEGRVVKNAASQGADALIDQISSKKHKPSLPETGRT